MRYYIERARCWVEDQMAKPQIRRRLAVDREVAKLERAWEL